ncbi:caspase-3-like [Ornithodoros turicata]|uniref:caspase-3-like n=1 Tax=Ornithodoros turicata TaxID=34597 RepID=UPI00313914B3
MASKLEQIEKYTIPKENRGQCAIINITVFQNKKYNRNSESDTQEAERAFKSLRLRTTIAEKKAATCDDVKEYLEGVRNEITDKDSMFAACIMSHGRRGEIMVSDMNCMKIQDIIDMFRDNNCEKLKGKPRLFFIQACQVETSHSQEKGMPLYWDYDIKLPSNFLVSFAVAPGFVAYRQIRDGDPTSQYYSLYIKALVKVFTNRGGHDVDIRELNAKVASEVAAEEIKPEGEDVKQMPCVISSLTKSLHL